VGAEEGRGTPTALFGGVLITHGRGNGNVRPNASDDHQHRYSLAGPKRVGPCFQRRNREIRVGDRDHLHGQAPPEEIQTETVKTENPIAGRKK